MKGGWDGDVGVQKCCKMSILSHDPMGSWGHSIGCPPVPLTDACVPHFRSIPRSHGIIEVSGNNSRDIATCVGTGIKYSVNVVISFLPTVFMDYTAERS